MSARVQYMRPKGLHHEVRFGIEESDDRFCFKFGTVKLIASRSKTAKYRYFVEADYFPDFQPSLETDIETAILMINGCPHPNRSIYVGGSHSSAYLKSLDVAVELCNFWATSGPVAFDPAKRLFRFSTDRGSLKERLALEVLALASELPPDQIAEIQPSLKRLNAAVRQSWQQIDHDASSFSRLADWTL